MVGNVEVFSSKLCLLGESPLWSDSRNSFFWLDILNKTIFEKSASSIAGEFDRSWVIEQTPTSLCLDAEDPHVLWVLTDKFFGAFNLATGSFVQKIQLSLAETHRTNDGFVSPDGFFYFGTMCWSPSEGSGSLYSISSAGVLENHHYPIAIPNTFVWQPEQRSKLIISDSMKKEIVVFEQEGRTLLPQKLLLPAEKLTNGEPDGGAFDIDGNLWLALWGSGSVICINPDGQILHEIELPCRQPSSCCFGGPELSWLLVTSASVDISDPTEGDGVLYKIELNSVLGSEVNKYRLMHAN